MAAAPAADNPDPVTARHRRAGNNSVYHCRGQLHSGKAIARGRRPSPAQQKRCERKKDPSSHQTAAFTHTAAMSRLSNWRGPTTLNPEGQRPVESSNHKDYGHPGLGTDLAVKPASSNTFSNKPSQLHHCPPKPTRSCGSHHP